MSGGRLQSVMTLVAVATTACGPAPAPSAPRPLISNSADEPGPRRAHSTGALCDAIAAAVDVAPDFGQLAVDPEPGESYDLPSTVEVADAEVTVQTTGIPDLTINFASGGVELFEQLRPEFERCGVFADGWDLETTIEDDEHDLTYRRSGGGARTLVAWMRVMSGGNVMICVHEA
jgi:hypothetical protein